MAPSMQVTLDSRPASKVEAEALVSYVFEPEKEQGTAIQGVVAELDRAAAGALGKLAASGELTGKMLEFTLVHFAPGIGAQRIVLIGAGKREKFGTAELRRLASAAVRYLKARSVKRIAFLVHERERNTEAAQALTEGLLLGNFDGDKYRTDKKNPPVESAALVGFDSAAQTGVERGRIIAESQNFTRELGNEPSNLLTPRLLAERAEAMAREAGLAVDILDEKRMEELKMGALLGVARGSVEPPRLIVLTYTPEKLTPGAPVLGFVGKAITFDTGGISIKPSNDMEKMKFDMAGGAAMLGAMRALARLKPPIKVIAVIPSTENMPGGRAQKPGDVQIAMSGKSIEVINTDAEGRLVLADVLHYVNKRFKPRFMINLATLTGAIIVALGQEYAGMFANDDKLVERLNKAGEATGERVWRMPLGPEYDKMIDSKFADMKNTGGRWGGAITAAQLLQRFVDKTPWAHLDIAGTGMDSPQSDINKSWASGWGVRLLDRLVEDYYER